MHTGKVQWANPDGHGTIITEEKEYIFDKNVVRFEGDVTDGSSITFDVDNYNNVKVIIASTTQDAASGAVTFKKESSSKKKKVLLTEEK
tara:strand:- start:2817 stop:3083 length:267 start_codon:yes stop_codon:yes gene_type:complete